MAHTSSVNLKVSSDFDFAKNLESRPFLFFFDVDGKPERRILVDGRLVNFRFRQHGKTLGVETDSKVADLREKLENWFGLGEDMSGFYRLCKKDPVLRNYLGNIRGIRLFSAPDDFEACVCIICSQMTGFPQYKAMTRRIYEAYGFFPGPKDILARPGLLDGCGVGYRKKFILSLAKSFPEWGPGLGGYSKNIFTLFQRRDYSSFYEDSLIRKIASEHYGFRGKNVREFASRRWGKWAGLAEVFLQKFLRDLKS